MSHVDFKKWQCPLSLYLYFHVDFEIGKCRLLNLRKGPCRVSNFFHMSIGFMSHVDFKKWLCRPVGFKGQGSPYTPLAGPRRPETGPPCRVSVYIYQVSQVNGLCRELAYAFMFSPMLWMFIFKIIQ